MISAGCVSYSMVTTDNLSEMGKQLGQKSESASSYRGEILGGILAQLILRAATGGTSCRNCVVKVHCDNRGF